MAIKGFIQKIFSFFQKSFSAKEAYCYKIANAALSNFQPNKMVDRDPFLKYCRRALVNSIAFCLYFEHTPSDLEFVRVFNLLEKAKQEIELSRSNAETSLKFMYANTDPSHRKHAGWRELETFNNAAPLAAHAAIQDVLLNFHALREC